MTYFWQFGLVFILSMIVDVFWTKYNLAVAAHRAHPAGFWSMMIVVGGTFATQIWLANKWVVLASMAGSYFGTWITVRREKQNDDTKAALDLLAGRIGSPQ